jgi:hypothetical protein
MKWQLSKLDAQSFVMSYEKSKMNTVLNTYIILYCQLVKKRRWKTYDNNILVKFKVQLLTLAGGKYMIKFSIKNTDCTATRDSCTQCCGSVTFWYGAGSGSVDPYISTTDVQIRIQLRILLFSSVTFKIPTKKNFKMFFTFTFWKNIYIIFQW